MKKLFILLFIFLFSLSHFGAGQKSKLNGVEIWWEEHGNSANPPVLILMGESKEIHLLNFHFLNGFELIHMESKSWSVFADMMKSFSCSPRILWVHQLTCTFPHSNKIAG